MLTPHGHDPNRLSELERKAKAPWGWYTSGGRLTGEEIEVVKSAAARQAAELRRAEK